MILEARSQNSAVSELPPLAFESMTRVQLAEFIPQLVTLSTGQSQPAFGKVQLKPSWWPDKVPWARPTLEQPQGKTETGLEVLKEIVRSCYKHMGQENLLSSPSLPVQSGQRQTLAEKSENKDLIKEETTEEDDSSVWICFVCAKEFDNQDSLMAHQDSCEDDSLMDDVTHFEPFGRTETNSSPEKGCGRPPAASASVRPPEGESQSSGSRPVPTLLRKIEPVTKASSFPVVKDTLAAGVRSVFQKSPKRKKWPDKYIPPPPDIFFSSLGLGPTPKVEQICKTPKRTFDEECEIIDLTIEDVSPTPQTPRTPRSLISQLSRDDSSARKRQLSFSQASPVNAASVKQVGSDSESCDSGTEKQVAPKRATVLKSALMAIDLSSPLGQRLKKHWKNEHQTSLVTDIEQYCATSKSVRPKKEPNEITDKLRHRPSDFPVTFRFTKKYLLKYCHSYKFNRADRKEFQKRLKTGLDKESRRLLRFVKPCSVKLKQLSAKVIKYWTTRKPRTASYSLSTLGRQMGQVFPQHTRFNYNRPVVHQNIGAVRNIHAFPPHSSIAVNFPTLSQTLTTQQRYQTVRQPAGPTPQLLVRTVVGKEAGQEGMRLEVVPILNHRDPSATSHQRPFQPVQVTSSPKRELTGSQKRKQVFDNVRADDDEISIISLSSDEEDLPDTKKPSYTRCRNSPSVGQGQEKACKQKIGPASFMRRLSERSCSPGGRSPVSRQVSGVSNPALASGTVTYTGPTVSKPVDQSNKYHTKMRMVNGEVVHCSTTATSGFSNPGSPQTGTFKPHIVSVYSLNSKSQPNSPSKPMVSLLPSKPQASPAPTSSTASDCDDYEVILIESEDDSDS